MLEIQRFLKVGRSTPAEARLDLSNRFGHLFFFGDLNYRIELKREEVLSLTRDRRYSELARYDQLKHQIKSGDAFAGFTEGEIGFAPTFKHVPGEGVDAGDLQDPATVAGGRPYEKKKMRVPSWCDRVLWRSWPGKADGLRLLKYASAPALASSDHTPVSALFELDIEVPMMSEGQHGGRLLGHVTIELSELSASGLRPADKNGLADPYVEVYSDFSSESAKTHAQLKTLSPKWSDKISLRVPHFHSWVQYIEAAHLFFILMDHDRITADDEMGCAVVSLAGVLLPDGTPGYAPFGRKFTVPLTRHGQPAGVLTGRLFAHIQTGSSARPNKLLPFLRHPSNWFGHVGEHYRACRRAFDGVAAVVGPQVVSKGSGLVRAHRWDRSPTQKKAPSPSTHTRGSRQDGMRTTTALTTRITALKPTTGSRRRRRRRRRAALSGGGARLVARRGARCRRRRAGAADEAEVEGDVRGRRRPRSIDRIESRVHLATCAVC